MHHSLTDRNFMDLEILNFNMFPHISRKNLNNSFFIRTKSDIGILSADLFSSEDDVFALGEVSLEVMSICCDVVELNQSSFFFVISVNLEVVLVKDDIVDSGVVLEDVGIYLFKENFLTYN